MTAASQRKIANWETAARYQMYHALALLAIGCLLEGRRWRLLHSAAAAMTAGTMIFRIGAGISVCDLAWI
jgi:uncharacterized membrane protein YgdD (TMEM256/DUF423 family)